MNLKWLDSGFQLCRISSIPVWVHYLAPLSAVGVTFSLWSTGRPEDLMIAALVGAGVLVSILIHETAHAATAVALGGQVSMIRLHPFGGDAFMHFAENEHGKFRLAVLAAPAANITIGTIILATYQSLIGDICTYCDVTASSASSDTTVWHRSFLWLGWCNVIGGLINLVPGYPLDGGLILHSFLEERWGDQRAKTVVGLVGSACGAIAFIATIAAILSGYWIAFPPSAKTNWSIFRQSLACKKLVDAATKPVKDVP